MISMPCNSGHFIQHSALSAFYVLLRPNNATATTKTRRTRSYTKEFIMDFFVLLCVLCAFVVVVAVPLSLGSTPALW